MSAIYRLEFSVFDSYLSTSETSADMDVRGGDVAVLFEKDEQS